MISLDAEYLYEELWLRQGLSLRKIGRRYGCSRTTVLDVIRSRYGKDACNPKKNGFARVIAQEYPEYQELCREAYGIPGRYLTTRKEQNMTTFQACDYEDIFAYEHQENREGLKLPLFILFATGLTDILYDLLKENDLQATCQGTT